MKILSFLSRLVPRKGPRKITFEEMERKRRAMEARVETSRKRHAERERMRAIKSMEEEQPPSGTLCDETRMDESFKLAFFDKT